MSSGNGIITLGDAIIYLRMSDFRDEDFTTFGEREQQLRDFAAGLGIPPAVSVLPSRTTRATAGSGPRPRTSGRSGSRPRRDW